MLYYVRMVGRAENFGPSCVAVEALETIVECVGLGQLARGRERREAGASPRATLCRRPAASRRRSANVRARSGPARRVRRYVPRARRGVTSAGAGPWYRSVRWVGWVVVGAAAFSSDGRCDVRRSGPVDDVGETEFDVAVVPHGAQREAEHVPAAQGREGFRFRVRHA